MKKIYAYLTLAMTSVLAAGLSSCSETKEEDNEFDNWQSRNETHFIVSRKRRVTVLSFSVS